MVNHYDMYLYVPVYLVTIFGSLDIDFIKLTNTSECMSGT